MATVAARTGRKKAFKAQGGRCFWCNHRVYRRHEPEWMAMPNQQLTAEHLIPRSAGGTNRQYNIVAACLSCNCRRGNMPVEQWVLFLKRNIHIHGGEAQFAMLLSKLSIFGISVVIGQPACGPDAVTPDCPPLKEMAPAP